MLAGPRSLSYDAVLRTNDHGVMAQTEEIWYSRPMVAIHLTCRHCGSENIVRNGPTTNGKQRFPCRDCGKHSRQDPQPNGYTEEEREEILRAYHERGSLRGLRRTFGVSRNTVSGWLEKGSRTPRVERHAGRAGPLRSGR